VIITPAEAPSEPTASPLLSLRAVLPAPRPRRNAHADLRAPPRPSPL